MKLFARAILITGLVIDFIGAAFAMDHGMAMGDTSSICATHCATLTSTSVMAAVPVSGRNLFTFFGLVVIISGGLAAALSMAFLRSPKRRQYIKPPIGLYRLNMTYTGYLI